MAVCFVVWTYLPFKPNFPEYCQCTLRLISGHYTCLFYLNHDVPFYYHSYHKTWKLFSSPLCWSKLRVVISNSVMPDSFTVTVWYWDIKWRPLIFHKKVKSDLKEDWHVMCIYEGCWIYGFGVFLFCLMRPLLRAFSPNSYYSDVCALLRPHLLFVFSISC